MIAAIYARLNTKAVDRALQRQTDCFTALQEASDHAVFAPERSGREAVPVMAIEGHCS
jgi:hypothetical protein